MDCILDIYNGLNSAKPEVTLKPSSLVSTTF